MASQVELISQLEMAERLLDRLNKLPRDAFHLRRYMAKRVFEAYAHCSELLDEIEAAEKADESDDERDENLG